MSRQQSHYDNLFVKANAPIEVIRASYKALAQKYHPDKNSSPDADRVMKLINQAWEVLSDPVRRDEHDEYIARTSSHQHSTSERSHAPPKPREQESQAARAEPKATGSGREGNTTELERMAFDLWFKGASQESLRTFLRERGLQESTVQELVQKVVNWS